MEPPARPDDHADEPPSSAEPGDAALISRVRTGDVAAYGTLYERHLTAARRLAHRLADRDTADDAVQDAFTKVLKILLEGGGPGTAFRPYLLTVVRRSIYDRRRADRRVHHTDTIENFDPGVPFDDPAIEKLERSMIARAFRSLPERWQMVLWHSAIEGERPADFARLLGLTANAAAALAYRAREGLSQAYLRMHLDHIAADDPCRPALERLGQYVRGALAERDSRTVKLHLDDCKRCAGLHAELVNVNQTLREALGPLLLGAATHAYLTSKGGGYLVLRRLPKRQQQVLGGGAVAATAVALAMVLVSGEEAVRPTPPPPMAAEPIAPSAAKPPAAARPPASAPALPPVRPAAAKAVPPPREVPVAEQPPPEPPPSTPITPSAPPSPAPPIDRPRGCLIHLHLRVSVHHIRIDVHVRVSVSHGKPRPGTHGVPHRGPRSAPHHVQRPVQHHAKRPAGRHGPSKSGSRVPRN